MLLCNSIVRFSYTPPSIPRSRRHQPCLATLEGSLDAQLQHWVAEAQLCEGATELSAAECSAAEVRTRKWVDRTLTSAGLAFCPYTSSADLSATGLEDLGVPPAPVLYETCASGETSHLMAEFWVACANMVAEGEEGVSSILLSAPGWDDEWDAWHRVVFPMIEASVAAAGLESFLGVVCFHPFYVTPDEGWRSANKFGHMHSKQRLREYLDEHDPPLSSATGARELGWAGDYQRRSPHATINVLWASQLEIAETRRRSSSLYARNLRTTLRRGEEVLECEALEERAQLISVDAASCAHAP